MQRLALGVLEVMVLRVVDMVELEATATAMGLLGLGMLEAVEMKAAGVDIAVNSKPTSLSPIILRPMVSVLQEGARMRVEVLVSGVAEVGEWEVLV